MDAMSQVTIVKEARRITQWITRKRLLSKQTITLISIVSIDLVTIIILGG